MIATHEKEKQNDLHNLATHHCRSLYPEVFVTNNEVPYGEAVRTATCDLLFECPFCQKEFDWASYPKNEEKVRQFIQTIVDTCMSAHRNEQ